MRFATERGERLKKSLIRIYTKCILEMRDKGKLEEVGEWEFLERVFAEKLVETPEELFFLGAMARAIYEIAPRLIANLLELLKNDLEEKKESN